jgi:hypothetical protein
MVYTEQRQFERYFPPVGAIATLRPFDEFGVINDISKGGVAFEYVNFSKDRDPGPQIGTEREIDIFVPGSDKRPLTVPCRIVRTQERLVGSYAHTVIPKKCCGVQFTNLDRETRVSLNAFLDRCGHSKGGSVFRKS